MHLAMAAARQMRGSIAPICGPTRCSSIVGRRFACVFVSVFVCRTEWLLPESPGVLQPAHTRVRGRFSVVQHTASMAPARPAPSASSCR